MIECHYVGSYGVLYTDFESLDFGIENELAKKNVLCVLGGSGNAPLRGTWSACNYVESTYHNNGAMASALFLVGEYGICYSTCFIYWRPLKNYYFLVLYLADQYSLISTLN